MAEEILDNNNNSNPDGNAGNNGTEKTFTQADVDRIVAQRIAREKKGMPTEDELQKFREWQQNNTDTQITTLTTERDKARQDLTAANEKITQYERERLLSSKGVPADDLDYYSFKIGKLVTKDKTFEDAADEFLADYKPNVKVDFGGGLNGGSNSNVDNDNAKMNDFIRNARK